MIKDIIRVLRRFEKRIRNFSLLWGLIEIFLYFRVFRVFTFGSLYASLVITQILLGFVILLSRRIRLTSIPYTIILMVNMCAMLLGTLLLLFVGLFVVSLLLFPTDLR